MVNLWLIYGESMVNMWLIYCIWVKHKNNHDLNQRAKPIDDGEEGEGSPKL